MIGTFLVQGLAVNLHCDGDLFPHLEAYFSSLCNGNTRSAAETLDLKLEICDTTLPFLPEGVQEDIGSELTYRRIGDRLYFISGDASLICLDPQRREANGFLTRDILNRPLDFFLFVSEPVAEMLKYSGLYCLHSAALCDDDISILISGPSRCGKTTTSLCLVAQGFKYLSDDTVLMEKVDGNVTVYPLYKNFNVDRNTARYFPQLFKKKCFPEEGKVPIDISETIPGSHIQSAKPNVILFPSIISDNTSKLRPIGQSEVYTKLLGQIFLSIDNNIAKKQLGVLQRLVMQSRGFELLSGKDLYDNSDSISRIIHKLKNADETS